MSARAPVGPSDAGGDASTRKGEAAERDATAGNVLSPGSGGPVPTAAEDAARLEHLAALTAANEQGGSDGWRRETADHLRAIASRLRAPPARPSSDAAFDHATAPGVVAWRVVNGDTTLGVWRTRADADEDLAEWRMNGKDHARVAPLYAHPPTGPDWRALVAEGLDRLWEFAPAYAKDQTWFNDWWRRCAAAMDAAPDTPPEVPRAFVLVRDEDVSGVSGTGTVAWGIEFPDGVVALRWKSAWPTSVVFHDRGMAAVEAVHGHGGKTRVVWLAAPGVQS